MKPSEFAYASVPREPTEEMLDAGCEALASRWQEEHSSLFSSDILVVWRAMYDAAPKGRR